LELHKSYYDYILNNAPATCYSGGSGFPTVAPTLTLKITGNDGTDAGKTVDSESPSPDNPDPSEQGTVFINSNATVNWKSTDAAYACTASGGWSGNKNDSSSWSGVTGTGSQTFSGIDNVTSYRLQCSGPGGTTSAKTVTAWPRPVITNFSGPSTNPAGNSYTISWNSKNAVRCNMSGDWSANDVGTSGSHQVYTSWDDHSTKHFTLTCYDPIGRSTSMPLNGDSNGVRQTAPDCSAEAHFSGGSTDNSYITWSTSCPAGDPPNDGWPDRYVTSNIDNVGTGYASTWYLGSGNQPITRADTYNFKIVVWIPGWGDKDNPIASASAGPFKVAQPITGGISVNGPHKHTKASGYSDGTCADSVHPVTVCVNWNSQNTTSCSAVHFDFFDAQHSSSGGGSTSGTTTFGAPDKVTLIGWYSITCFNSFGDSKDFSTFWGG
jgi:hypothetical protein